MVEPTLESFTSLLAPMLGLLVAGLLWLALRGTLRLASRTFLLGCGLVVGLGAAWMFITALRFF